MRLPVAVTSAVLVSTAALAQLDFSDPLVGDRFDPYVTADEITVTELPETAQKPQIGDRYDPYVTPDEIQAEQGVPQVIQPSIGDQYDPYVVIPTPDETELAQFEPAPDGVTLEADTTFGFDEAQLTDEGRQLLDELVARAERFEDPQFRITGHADALGPESYNEDLSARRAEAVKDYLVSKGVSEDAIETAARGSNDPVVSCEGLSGDPLIECLGPNRRAVIEFAAFETEGE